MNKILELKFGSHLYGTDTPDSDLDYKAIYIPTAKQIVLANYNKTICKGRKKSSCERNTKDDVDLEIFSLDRYLDLLMEGQTVALDILFAPEHMYTQITDDGRRIISTIRANKDRLITRNINAFIGYARQQAAKYGIKGSRMDALKRAKEMFDKLILKGPYTKLIEHENDLKLLVKECESLVSLEKYPLIEIVLLKGPKGLIDAPHLRLNGRNIPFHANVKYAKEIIEKMLEGYGQRAKKAHLAGGVDWKALSHAVRVNSEALELLETGNISFPRPDRDLLLKIKLGMLPYEQVAEIIEEGLAKLYTANEKSILPDKSDVEWAKEFIYNEYMNVIWRTNVGIISEEI